MMKNIFIVVLGLGLSACTSSLHVSHQGDFHPTYASYQKGEWIEASSEQFVIMGFVMQTDYVDQAVARFKNECRDGAIQGVQTQFSTDHNFFSWTNRIRMQGLCLKQN